MRVEEPKVGLERSIVRCWEEESNIEVVKWCEDLEMHQMLRVT